MLALLLVAVPAVVSARGTLTGNGAQVDHSPEVTNTGGDDPRRTSRVADAIRMEDPDIEFQTQENGYDSSVCGLPSPEACEDINYADTSCGQYHARVYRQYGESPCVSYCDAHPPSLADCQSPTWNQTLCGRIEAELRGDPDSGQCTNSEPRVCVAHPSTCLNLVRAHLRAQQVAANNRAVFTALPTGRVLMPSNGNLQNTQGLEYGYASVGVNPQRSTQPIQTFEAARGRLKATGNGPFHWSGATADSMRLVGPNKTAAITAFDAKRAEWDNNGALWSCDEFVYEKYYTLSKFEDRKAKLGANYRAIFDVAYNTGGTGTVPSYALGALALTTGVAFYQKDGAALDINVFPPDKEVKRPFFGSPDIRVGENDDGSWVGEGRLDGGGRRET